VSSFRIHSKPAQSRDVYIIAQNCASYNSLSPKTLEFAPTYIEISPNMCYNKTQVT